MKFKQLLGLSCLSVAMAAASQSAHSTLATQSVTQLSSSHIKSNQNAHKHYLVMMKPDTSSAQMDELIATIEQQLNGAKLKAFSIVKGFSGPIPSQLLGQLRQHQQVKYIERDQLLTAPDTESPHSSKALKYQTNGNWGIDRLDQTQLPLDDDYSPNGDGAGVHAYIIDSGIRVSHSDFAGRASWDFTASNLSTTVDDEYGHGTHVAGVIGSSRFGVARQVNLHAVKVLDHNGVGTLAGLIEGIEYVTNNHQIPAVATIGVNHPYSQMLNDAVTASINAGVVYTVPAGDAAVDACEQSPASLATTITVASSTASDSASPYSNTGSCVDIYAPGLYVKSSWHTTDYANNTISHTPIAAAHVAGAAAIILGNDNGCSVSEVKEKLVAQANSNRLNNVPAATHNRLLAVPRADAGANTQCGSVIADADNDGIADELDLCANSAADARVDANGCAVEQLNQVTVSVPADLRGNQLAQVNVTPAAYSACDNSDADFCGYYLAGTQVTINAVNISAGYEVSEWQNTMCEANLSCVVSSDTFPNVVLNLSQNRAIAQVSSDGGTVEYQDVATATFYNNSFSSSTQVTVDTSNDASLWQDFDVTKHMFAASYAANEFIVIDTDSQAPQQDVSISVNLAQSYLDNQPANTQLTALVSLVQQSSDVTIESFELLDSQLQGTSLNATLPKQSFSALANADGHYLAVVMVAAIPNDSNLRSSVKTKALALTTNNRLVENNAQWPAEININTPTKTGALSVMKAEGNPYKVQQRDHQQDIEQLLQQQPAIALPKATLAAKASDDIFTSAKNSMTRSANAAQCPVSITAPIANASALNQAFVQNGFHGVNYQLSQSETFVAVRNGTIVKAGEDLRYLADGSEKGWGRYVILQDDGGHRFLYSHLASGHVSEGTAVTKGDVIGNTAGNFGHFEFAPVQSAKINPTDCVEQSSSGLNCTIVDINANYIGNIANSNDLLCVAVYPEVATKFTGFITNYNPSNVDFDLSLFLYNPDDGGILSLAQSTTTGTFDLIAGVLNPSWYLMVVNGKNGATGSFTIGSQGITDFDSNEYNDTSATATVVTGVKEITGSFDSPSDVDWFRYDFGSTVPTARIYNHNDNATMTIVAATNTQIPAGSWATISGTEGQSVYIVMQNNQTVAPSTTASKNSTAPWKISVTGIEHHTSNVNWGSSEYFNVRVDYWPQVHDYYQMSGKILDASNALIPNGRVFLLNTAVSFSGFSVFADANGSWNYRVDYTDCRATARINKTTTDNYGRYLWILEYTSHFTNWWAVNQPTHLLTYNHLCDAEVVDSAPW